MSNQRNYVWASSKDKVNGVTAHCAGDKSSYGLKTISNPDSTSIGPHVYGEIHEKRKGAASPDEMYLPGSRDDGNGTTRLQLLLDEDLPRVKDEDTFCLEVRADLASAIRLPKEQVVIEELYSRGRFLVVHAKLDFDNRDIGRTVRSLEAALDDPHSTLRQGRHTRRAVKVALLPCDPCMPWRRTDRGRWESEVNFSEQPADGAGSADTFDCYGRRAIMEAHGHSGYEPGQLQHEIAVPDSETLLYEQNQPRRRPIFRGDGAQPGADADAEGGGSAAREMEHALGALVRAMEAQNDDLRRLSAVQDAVTSVYGHGGRPSLPPGPPLLSHDENSEAGRLGRVSAFALPAALGLAGEADTELRERPWTADSDPTRSPPKALQDASESRARPSLGEVEPHADGGSRHRAGGSRVRGESDPGRQGRVTAGVENAMVLGPLAAAGAERRRGDGHELVHGQAPTRAWHDMTWWGSSAAVAGRRAGSFEGDQRSLSPVEGCSKIDKPSVEAVEGQPSTEAKVPSSARHRLFSGFRVDEGSGPAPTWSEPIASRLVLKRPLNEGEFGWRGGGGDGRLDSLADLSADELAALIAATPVREREGLLLSLSAADVAEVIRALPPSEGSLTLRQLSGAHVRRIVEGMVPGARESLILRMSPRELEGLVDGLGAAALADLLTGMTKRAVSHVFRGVSQQLQVALLAVLGDRDRCAMLADLMPRERDGLLSALPSRVCGSVLRQLRSQHIASVYHGMQRDRFLRALEELVPEDQRQILDFLPRKDRHEILAMMSRPSSAMICSVMSQSDRVAAVQAMEPADGASILVEMSSSEAVEVLSSLSSSLRAAILLEMGERSRAVIAMTMAPEVLAPALLVMNAVDRKALIVNMQPQERAALFSAMTSTERAYVWKELMSGESAEYSSDLLEVVLKVMSPDEIASALSEMIPEDRVKYLLLMSLKGRAAVLQSMGPRDSAEALDQFLLEDRASTVRLMDVQTVSRILQEIPPHKKALLLASMGHKERGAALSMMSSHDLSRLLSVLPLADCVGTLKVLGPKMAADALLEMSVQESALTLEAIPTRERASIMLAMQPEDAANILDRLQPDICAATLKYFNADATVTILTELPFAARGRMISGVSTKSRAKVLSEMDQSDRAVLLGALQPTDLLNTIKEMNLKDIESCFGSMVTPVRLQVLLHIPCRESSRMILALSLEEQAELLGKLPFDMCDSIFKFLTPPSILQLLNYVPGKIRDQLVASLPEKVRKEIQSNTPSPAAVGISSSSIKDDTQVQASPEISSPRNPKQQNTGKSTQSDMSSGQLKPLSYKSSCQASNSFKLKPVSQIEPGSSAIASFKSPSVQNVFSSRSAQVTIKSTAVQTVQTVAEESVVITLRSRMNSDTFTDVSARALWIDQICGDIAAAVGCSVKRLVIDDLRPQIGIGLDGSNSAISNQADIIMFNLKILPIQTAIPDIAGNDSRSAREIANEIASQGQDPRSRLNRLHQSMLCAQLGSSPNRPTIVQANVAQQNQSFAYNQSLRQLGLPQGNFGYSHDQGVLSDSNSCGVGIAFVPTQDGKFLSVMQIAPDCSASPEKSVVVGDVICSIDGQDITGSPLPHVARSLLGPPGSNVMIGFQSPGTKPIKTVQLLRSNASPNATIAARVDVKAPKLNAPQNIQNAEKVLSKECHSGSEQIFSHKRAAPEDTLQHNIWHTIEDLDNAIERRVSDMKSFTQSIMKLQMEAEEASNRINSLPESAGTGVRTS